LSDLAEHKAKIGDFQGAQEVADLIDCVRDRDGVFRTIAREIAKGGELEMALKIARSITDKYWRAHALIEIASAMKAGKDYPGIDDVIAEALSAVREMDSDTLKVKTLCSIAILMEENDSLAAERLIDIANETKPKMSKELIEEYIRALHSVIEKKAASLRNVKELTVKLVKIKMSAPNA
jgi:hypothetical protein